VGHRVPSHVNWSLHGYRCTQHYTQIPRPAARVFNYSLFRISVIRSDKELCKRLRLWGESRGYHGQEQWRTEGFCWGFQQIQLRTEDRENGDLGAVAPLVSGSGSSCNLVEEISIHIVNFS